MLFGERRMTKNSWALNCIVTWKQPHLMTKILCPVKRWRQISKKCIAKMWHKKTISDRASCKQTPKLQHTLGPLQTNTNHKNLDWSAVSSFLVFFNYFLMLVKIVETECLFVHGKVSVSLFRSMFILSANKQTCLWRWWWTKSTVFVSCQNTFWSSAEVNMSLQLDELGKSVC